MLCRVALPSHACEKLDKVNRDFLWGSSTEKRKLHLVGWSKIIKSKDERGGGGEGSAFRQQGLKTLPSLPSSTGDSTKTKILCGQRSY